MGSYLQNMRAITPDMIEAGQVKVNDRLEGDMSQYPQTLWCTGLKLPLMEPEGDGFAQTRLNAVGMHIERAKMPESLQKAAQTLVDSESGSRKPLYEWVFIEHEGGNVKEYLHLAKPQWIILAHNAFPHSQIMDYRDGAWQGKPENYLGVAGGIWTKPFKQKKLCDTSTFIQVLAIETNLYKAGYIDKETRLPGVICLKFVRENSTKFVNGLMAHSRAMASHRKRVIERALRDGELHGNKTPSRPVAEFWAKIYVQMWSYKMCWWETNKPEQHVNKETQQSQKVFEPFNHTEGSYASFEAMEALWIGEEMIEQVMPWLYDMQEDESPEIGGPALEWCKKSVERALENQRQWNPEKKNNFGLRPMPLWMEQALAAEARGVEPPAQASRQTGNAAPPAPATAAPARQNGNGGGYQIKINALTELLKGYQVFFKQHSEDQGDRTVWDDAQLAISQMTSEAEIAKHLEKVMQEYLPRYTALRSEKGISKF